MDSIVPLAAGSLVPALIARGGAPARHAFLEFFAARIRNPHTRRAYARAAAEFLAWAEDDAGLAGLDEIEPIHVAAWTELAARDLSVPTVKQRLAAVRHLFDWLVLRQVIATNPAAGPAIRCDAARRRCSRPPRRTSGSESSKLAIC